MGAIIGLVVVVVLIAATAFFVAVEFALVAVDRNEVDLAAADGDRRSEMVAKQLRQLSMQLSGVQLGITVCSVGIGYLAKPSVAYFLQSPLEKIMGESSTDAIALFIALLIATVVQMVIGELIPKSIAVARPLRTSRLLAPANRAYAALFRPIIVVFGAAADWVVRKMGVEPTEELSQVRSRHELEKLVETSGADGSIDAEEVKLLTKTFRFHHKSADEVLTPRTSLVALPITAVGHDLRDLSNETGFSRFLVFGDDLDDILGLVHVKSLFDIAPERRDEVPISELLTDVLMVPESRRLDSLMVEMRANAAYLCVVLDEYGGTSGIITMEDLLEEIVGEIADEHDQASSDRPVWRWGGTSVVSGRLNLDEMYDATSLRIPEGDYETVAGFVLSQLGTIPGAGASFVFEGRTFEVLEMDRRRVATVRVVDPLESLDSLDQLGPPEQSSDGGHT